MSHSRNTLPKISPPGRIDWSDEKLARFNAEHLQRLLEDLGTQRAIGRISTKEALDLARRIVALLPASVLDRRRLLSRTLAQLDAQAAAEFRALALAVTQRNGVSGVSPNQESAEILWFIPPPYDEAAWHLQSDSDCLLEYDEAVASLLAESAERSRLGENRGRMSVRLARCYAEAQETYRALITRLVAKPAPRD